MQTKFDGLHLFAGRLSLFASHLVGAGLCSARGCRFRRKNGRSRAPPLQNAPQRLPFQGPIPPIRGKCPEGTKGVGMLSPKVTERLYQICRDLSVSASPSHLPWKGRLWAVLICKIIRHYGNIAIYAKHSTLRYNNPPISKEALALPRRFWYPESS